MGQTLPNGIYLPAEGERNCYDGLEGNWRSLDSLISTVAGKASATHTHGNISNDGKVGTTANLPLITGTSGTITTGSFGTSANTFCEGNDSRLSDARTPVAHTHTKSDVTDLLNSNFIPSANNTYDLGSSSYQWNNLYAKNYYYNGVAWGLDKANVWTGNNTYTIAGITLKNDYVARGTIPNVNRNYILNFTDSNNDTVGMIFQQIRSSSGSYKMTFSMNNGTTDHRIDFFGFTDGSSSFIPDVTNTTDLGSSTNKWKSLNGINPGALSLPNLASDGYIELSDNISANTEYAYTPAVDGWLALYVQTTGFHAENAVAIFNGSGSGSAYRWASSATSGINLARLNKYHGAVILPVRAGIPYLCWIKIDSSTTLIAKMLYFYKAAGNV